MKFYVYIHTHWDREWYFTNGTSQVLLKNNINFYLKNPTLSHFYLDGQVSLVDDYLKIVSNENAEKFLNLIRENKIITGPWYIQPDLFNALGETTIRNLELAKYVAKQNNFELSTIMYAPDTFGFPVGFPELLNTFKFKQMIFWRGLNYTMKHDNFLWKNSNFREIECYNLKFGYFFLGKWLNWSNLTKQNLETEAKQFIEKFNNSDEYKHFVNQNQEIILIGSGHDQAAPYQLIEEFFKILNKLSVDSFEIKTHEQYFNEKHKNVREVLPLYNEPLDYATNSKIHRTISSSRYSLKKVFRDVEHLLYHQLEPLQLAIKSVNNYDTFQNITWQKGLVKMQAHDALGGCVSDEVYLENFTKLNDIKNQINSEIDYIMKQIGNQMKLEKDELLFFNPNIGEHDNSIVHKKITLNKKHNLVKHFKDYSIYVVFNSKSNLIKNGFLHDVIFVNKNMKPFELAKINLNELENIEPKTTNLNYNNQLQLIVEDDLGDTYDFDPNVKKSPRIISLKKSILANYDSLLITTSEFVDSVSKQKFVIKIFSQNSKSIYEIETVNKLKNSRVSLLFPKKEDLKKIKYQQLLFFINLQEDSQKNWEKYYKEKPINNYRTSGVISSQNYEIQTFGTNEFYIYDNRIAIVLYRTIGRLGKAHLTNRPGPVSGLDSKIVETPLAQYFNKKLKFNFTISENGVLNGELMNSFIKTPIMYHHNSIDVETNKLGQFIFDPNNAWNLNFKTSWKLNKYSNFLSSTWINFNNIPRFTEVDLQNNTMEITENEL